jgi:hypothetical protein
MCITKMSRGGGGVYLEGEFDRGERELMWLNKEIAGGGGWIREREGGEERKKRWKRRKKWSCRSALLCPKGAG